MLLLGASTYLMLTIVFKCLPMHVKEHTQNNTKEQLDIAQKRLNSALNNLETQVKNQIVEWQDMQIIQEDMAALKKQNDYLAEEKEALATALTVLKDKHQALQATSQDVSQELSSSIDTLESILKKHTLLEALEG